MIVSSQTGPMKEVASMLLGNQIGLIPDLGGDTFSWIMNILFYAFFIIFMFYGQKIQIYVMLREVENSLHKLKRIKDKGRKNAIETIQEIGKPETDPSDRVDRFLEYFTIQPQKLDPSGVVWKLEHILDTRESRFEDDVKLMAPEADETQISNLENTLEAGMALNYIYKLVRHFYLRGKKTMSMYIIMQLRMILPLVMRQAKAYASALKAFAYGQPIGDGAGSLVAAKLLHGHSTRKVAKDCIAATVPIEDREVTVIKSEGPGGNVGKPGDGIKNVVEENEGDIATIIMVDAALKLEGEKVGKVAEGVGAAIGGPGVDQFKIEESVLEHDIPLNAIAIKEDIGDAVSPMRKEIVEAVDHAIDRVKRVIREKTEPEDKVILTGVGNTIGIGQ